MPLVPPLDASPEEVRALLAPIRSDFSVALDTCANPFAVGAIVRASHNFLAREIILIGDAPFYEKASMGMEKYENVVRVSDENAFLEHVQGKPVYALERECARRSIYDVAAFPAGVVFLFGSERFGIGTRLLARADDVLGIPLHGVNHSLPVAIAAGITMSEWARRHRWA